MFSTVWPRLTEVSESSQAALPKTQRTESYTLHFRGRCHELPVSANTHTHTPDVPAELTLELS